jgi:hypothetical protein
MSFDNFYFVENGKITEIRRDEVDEVAQRHTIVEQRAGIQSLYFYDDAVKAAEDFEKWRREPCEFISLTLDGMRQSGDRLPLMFEGAPVVFVEGRITDVRVREHFSLSPLPTEA